MTTGKLLKFLLLTPVIAMVLMGCGKDKNKEGAFTLTFAATFDSEPLQTFKTYTLRNGEHLQFSHLSMMISDVELLNGSDVTSLDDIAFVDLSFDNANAASNGVTIIDQNINAETYTGIRFSIGVPESLNTMKPADFNSSHPLSRSGYYWTAWNSYIFSKTEGKLDTANTETFDFNFALHTGANELFRTFEVNVPITVVSDGTLGARVLIDYEQLIGAINLENNPQNHDPADLSIIGELTDNFQDALTLQLP